MIECKVSRADFLRDKNKPSRIGLRNGVGNRRAYLCLDGLIKADEIPEGWGLLYSSETGSKVRKIVWPKEPQFTNNALYELSMIISGARRFNDNLFIKGEQ